jgi:hypothetical protein
MTVLIWQVANLTVHRMPGDLHALLHAKRCIALPEACAVRLTMWLSGRRSWYPKRTGIGCNDRRQRGGARELTWYLAA